MRSADSSMWSRTKGRVSEFKISRVAAPWEHEVLEMDELSAGISETVRDFDYQRQRRRLVANSALQWFITASLCVALVAVLYYYSHIQALSQPQKYTFNALVTGLSVSLSLSLSSSLRGYALMMRWRLLATKYRSLQNFDLILSCDDQMKVVRLLWAARTPGRGWIPNKTQTLCFIWLFINVALQVFTALLGLTYSVDISTTSVYPVWGNVSIADLSNINTLGYDSPDFSDQAGAANTYGIEGQDFYNLTNIPVADQVGEETYYSNSDYTTFWYRFQDQNPTNYNEVLVSKRTVSTTAQCDQFKVLSGGDTTQNDHVTYFDTNLQQNVTQQIHLYALGCSTYMSNTNRTCGPRCTNINVLTAADNQTGSVPFPLWFSCNNTVGPVTNIDDYAEPAKYMLPDEQARAWAGAIGFSGIHWNGTSFQYVLYEYDSDWALNAYPDNQPGTAAVAQNIMEFTAGGIAATDVYGPRINVTGYYPTQGQVVDIQWNWAVLLLAGIPGGQFLVLLAVLIWANKVIIKDESHLSTARLLRPVVDKLGEKGCLLTGNEIVEVLGNFRLKYGARDPPQDSMGYRGLGGAFVRHVDVIKEVEGLGRADARMVNGLYDGISTWNTKDNEREPLLRKRKTRKLSL
jgi:hypothetical protein